MCTHAKRLPLGFVQVGLRPANFRLAQEQNIKQAETAIGKPFATTRDRLPSTPSDFVQGTLDVLLLEILSWSRCMVLPSPSV
jgi:hypothetical protein